MKRTIKKAILGKKIGMTSFFTEDGAAIPITIVECGPCPVVSIKTDEKDGYNAIQIGFQDIEERKLSKPLRGLFEKNNIAFKKYLKEFRNTEKEYKIGDIITVEDFEINDKVRVSGISKGKGFQGVVKRHHFSGVGMQSHGQHDRERHPGSIGGSSNPSKVFKGVRMAGQMGNKRVTIRNIEVVEVIADKNLILFKGSLPGAPNSLLEIVKV
ncbi:MAG: 50S ribosomal protein L3 [Ignavibacteria bacterium]|jgi:large subunit ribosomal protein L3|nr:50S ribosomal protein L3 [Ignavibacteria bacterium]